MGSDEIEGVFQKFFLTYSQWTKPFIKVFLKKPSKILLLRGNPVIAPSLTPCLKAILWPPHLFPVGKAFFKKKKKKFRSLNPHLETVLSTYPARISPTIPYSNFCNWKTTRFLKKFSLNPIPQLSKPKNDIFSETFSKNVLTPLPHVFGQKTDTLFQKSFLLLYRKFFRANLNCDFEKIPLTYLDWKQNLPTLFSKKT